MVLLRAVTVDGNGQTVILAWAVVESESISTWRWFLHDLLRELPSVFRSTIMIDRGEGLLAAEEILGPHITKAHCCVHLLRDPYEIPTP